MAFNAVINLIRKTCTNKMSDFQAQEWACRGTDEDLVNHEFLTYDQILQIAGKVDGIHKSDKQMVRTGRVH